MEIILLLPTLSWIILDFAIAASCNSIGLFSSNTILFRFFLLCWPTSRHSLFDRLSRIGWHSSWHLLFGRPPVNAWPTSEQLVVGWQLPIPAESHAAKFFFLWRFSRGFFCTMISGSYKLIVLYDKVTSVCIGLSMFSTWETKWISPNTI